MEEEKKPQPHPGYPSNTYKDSSCSRCGKDDYCNLCGKCQFCDHCYGCGMCGGGDRDGGYNCGFCD